MVKLIPFYLILAIHPAIAPETLTGAKIQKAVGQPPQDSTTQPNTRARSSTPEFCPI